MKPGAVKWSARLARLAALVAFVAAQLGSVFHLGLVRHEVCEEHGELVEVGSALGPARASDAPDADHDAPDPSAEDDRHDDCPFLLHDSHALASAPMELSTPIVFADGGSGRARNAKAARPPLSVLDVAPKTSPPV